MLVTDETRLESPCQSKTAYVVWFLLLMFGWVKEWEEERGGLSVPGMEDGNSTFVLDLT